MPETEPQTSRRGRPRSEAAASHSAILDAVYELLQEKSARDLTMEEVAKRAKVGRPTLYKWWPSKAALVFAMFQERVVGSTIPPPADTAEQTLRNKVRSLIREFNGLFGRVMADLLAEGQSDPEVLRDLHERHVSQRQAAAIADVERGIADGEFRSDTDPKLLMDSLIGPIYFRLLMRHAPLTEQFGEELINQVLLGVRA